jgi:hypothetical protein
MSRTYRTDKEGRIAERRMPRDREGNLVMPRIVRRKPRRGDVHPITNKQLMMVFDRLPLEYLYNLTSVELLPRKDGIGNPFGYYSALERRIVLYSLPLNWETEFEDELSADFFGPVLRLEEYPAEVETDENIARVKWSNEEQMGFWFTRIVLLHEFVHHFRANFRSKRKAGWSIKREHEEFLTDQQAIGLFDDVFPEASKAHARDREERRKRRRPEFERRRAKFRAMRARTQEDYSERNPTSRHD